MNVELRVRAHLADLRAIQRDFPRSWAENIGTAPDLLVPDIEPVDSSPSLSAIAAGIPLATLEVLRRLGGFVLFGLRASNSYRFRLPSEIQKYSAEYPEFVRILVDASLRLPPKTSVSVNWGQAELMPLHRDEIESAVVLAGENGSGEDALLWIPEADSHYAVAGSWSGCQRFRHFDDAFEHLLSSALEALRESLS